MQNHTSMNISPISERILALIAEGVGFFKAEEDLSSCQKCPLAHSRKKVLFSPSKQQKDFFIISEYPDQEDELAESLYSLDSSSGVILNLINKLGIQDQSHYAFAVKCLPYKQLPQVGLSTCVVHNLLNEIQTIQPQHILCFGARTFYALASIDPELFYQAHNPSPEGHVITSSKPFRFQLHKRLMNLYWFPTAQELKHSPQWRAPVWAQLAHFKSKKNIDS